jgi:hypothetical protein
MQQIFGSIFVISQKKNGKLQSRAPIIFLDVYQEHINNILKNLDGNTVTFEEKKIRK